jgi:hypothetical protein
MFDAVKGTRGGRLRLWGNAGRRSGSDSGQQVLHIVLARNLEIAQM